ncbi:MAG: hypothetical protein AB7U73_24135, partial [Pirellulales bacterium]
MSIAKCRRSSGRFGFVREVLKRLLVVAALTSTIGATAAEPPAPAPSAEPPAVAEKDQAATEAMFPAELVRFVPYDGNPVFTGAGPDHWDVKIRERGWILREADGYRMWYTGYDGTREGRKLLGLATSDDGLEWTRWPANPLDREHWIEDMQVLRHEGT